LEAAYEATLLAAMLEGPDPASAPEAPPIAVLTFLGGGVFGNAEEWIEHALAGAVGRAARRGAALQVVVTHHTRVDEAKAAGLERAIASHRDGSVVLHPCGEAAGEGETPCGGDDDGFLSASVPTES
jgi:hypothetical protein